MTGGSDFNDAIRNFQGPLVGSPEERLRALGSERLRFEQRTSAREQPRVNSHSAALTHNDTPLVGINPATLHGLPIPSHQWLVPDWIPLARITALYGAGGEGKTLLAQMLATACALGAKWLGQKVLQCRSVLLFAEDDLDEMHARQADINHFYGCTFADLEAMLWLPRLGEDCELMWFENGRVVRTPLLDQLLGISLNHEAKLVITDTLSDVFCGNEMDRAQVRRFGRQALGYIANQTKAALLAPAHPSQTGINRGDGDSASTGWKGTFRSQLYLSSTKPTESETEPDPNIRTLTRTKVNWAKRGETIEMKWKNGVFMPLHENDTGIISSIERKKCDRVFLDLLDKMTTEGRRVSDNNHASNYAPKIFSMRPDRERFTKQDFEKAMQGLFASQEIKLGTYRGSSRHPLDCIVRTAPK